MYVSRWLLLCLLLPAGSRGFPFRLFGANETTTTTSSTSTAAPIKVEVSPGRKSNLSPPLAEEVENVPTPLTSSLVYSPDNGYVASVNVEGIPPIVLEADPYNINTFGPPPPPSPPNPWQNYGYYPSPSPWPYEYPMYSSPYVSWVAPRMYDPWNYGQMYNSYFSPPEMGRFRRQVFNPWYQPTPMYQSRMIPQDMEYIPYGQLKTTALGDDAETEEKTKKSKIHFVAPQTPEGQALISNHQKRTEPRYSSHHRHHVRHGHLYPYYNYRH